MKTQWIKFKKWLIRKLGGYDIPVDIPVKTQICMSKPPVKVTSVQTIDKDLWDNAPNYRKMCGYKTRDALVEEVANKPGVVKTELTLDRGTGRYILKETVYIIPFEEVE